MKPTYAWVIKNGDRYWVARSTGEYGPLHFAQVFATRENAKGCCENDGDRPVKVEITLKEVL